MRAQTILSAVGIAIWGPPVVAVTVLFGPPVWAVTLPLISASELAQRTLHLRERGSVRGVLTAALRTIAILPLLPGAALFDDVRHLIQSRRYPG